MAIPKCAYFKKCGGCNLQHVDYALQLENKRKKVEKLLGVKTVEVFFGSEYFYRNRIDFLFSKNCLGMRSAQKSTLILPVEKCVIGSNGINRLAGEVHDFFGRLERENRGVFNECVIRETSKGKSSISFELLNESDQITWAFEMIQTFCKQTSATSVLIKCGDGEEDFEVVKGSEFLSETLCGRDFFYSSLGFFQNNPIVAQKMFEFSKQILSSYDTSHAQLLDLYGGVGTFGIVNASLFKDVFIVENSKDSIMCAQKNIERNNIKNVQAFVLDATQMERLVLKKPLYVICDPPRSGMDAKVIPILNRLLPEVILYVSCNPEQLAKDVLKFKGYVLRKVALFDMFAQTNHMEVMVELKRK